MIKHTNQNEDGFIFIKIHWNKNLLNEIMTFASFGLENFKPSDSARLRLQLIVSIVSSRAVKNVTAMTLINILLQRMSGLKPDYFWQKTLLYPLHF